MTKPMLACDWDELKVRFPIFGQPKIDGVRAINLQGATTGRSLKKFKNKHVTELFSDSALKGFDGEMAAESEMHPDLCRFTSSALGTIEGKPYVLWWLFDYVQEDWIHQPYFERYCHLQEKVRFFRSNNHIYRFADHLRVVPYKVLTNMSELLEYETDCLSHGFEGVILRDPEGKVKHGRCTVREGSLLRIKRFIDDEAVVIRLEEGQTNLNEATINALGKTERSTHAENMVPNGQVGTLVCEHKKSGTINVSPGEMDVETRKLYFKQPELIVGKTITFKTFPKGVKDKPRFPTFKNIREDL